MDNRSNILACALQLFASRGYDAVGVQEIVEAAGITKPTLYHYFGNKLGLLNALLQLYFEPLNQEIRETASYHGDLPLNLTKIAAAYFRYAQEEPAFYRMQLAMTFAPPDSESRRAVAEFSMNQARTLEEMFALASKDHGNMKGRQRTYAATFIGMVNTYIGLWLYGHVELADAQVYQAVHQFMHGIFS